MKFIPILLLTLTACSPKAETPRRYVCFNPFMPIQSFQFETGAGAKEEGDTIIATSEDGATSIIVPRSLCVQVVSNEKAQ